MVQKLVNQWACQPIAAPICVAAVFPIGQVRFGNGIWKQIRRSVEVKQNGAIGEAIIEHLVDVLADGLRQASDFAVALAVRAAEDELNGELRLPIHGNSWKPNHGEDCCPVVNQSF